MEVDAPLSQARGANGQLGLRASLNIPGDNQQSQNRSCSRQSVPVLSTSLADSQTPKRDVTASIQQSSEITTARNQLNRTTLDFLPRLQNQNDEPV